MGARPRGEGRKKFFFEKRTKKLLIFRLRIVAAVSFRRHERGSKSFLLLFFKKEMLAFP